MSLNTSNSYTPYLSFVYPQASCCYYYSNSSQTYLQPVSIENTSPILNAQVQFRRNAKKHRHNKRRHYASNNDTNKLYPTINSISRTTSTSPLDYRMNGMDRPASRRSDRREQVANETSLENSSSTFERFESFYNSADSPILASYNDCCRIIKQQSINISTQDLTRLLNELTPILRQFNNDSQREQHVDLIIDALNALIGVRPSILLSISQHEFFSILRTSFIHVLYQWHHQSFLLENESVMFRIITKLIEQLVESADDIRKIPLWLFDSTLLEAISTCLIDIANSPRFLDQHNKSQFKSFTYLIDAYIHYQVQLNQQHQFQKDKLIQLLDPILQCLTSSQYIHTFTNLPTNSKSMTTIEKFFLIKAPSFLTSYYGSRLEQTMDRLLSSMLSRYVELFSRFVPLSSTWKRSMIRSFDHLLDIINHGSDQFQVNAKHVSNHLSLIDNVLKLLNEPILYDNIDETLSNVETILMNRAISFLVNMINEPTILSYIKQSRSVGTFLRLTSCKYEPIVYNVYTLLAYTTREEDIKAMQNPGRLLSTIIESLKTTFNIEPLKRAQIEQLLETLKGLVQHDQIKDEIIKQNALSFLLEWLDRLIDKPYILILEILWSLTFREEIARTLRGNSDFVRRIETISKNSTNEPLKKAADGLVWQLIQEAESLVKVAKQEEGQQVDVDEITTTEVVVGEDGEKQVVTTKKRGSTTPTEPSYRYDIMISYCHADKELTYKIHKFLLDQGFKVWIDLDNMYGPAMSAMAEAVENSEFVIMCMSDSYKQSTYCQAEAEYAFKCKRRLIPLIMRQGYRPDGWLGFMIGTRTYIDYGRYEFKIACNKLLTEINLQRKQNVPSILVNLIDHLIPDASTLAASPDEKKNTKPRVVQSRSEKLPMKKDLLTTVIKARQAKLDFMRKSIYEWAESDVTDFLLANRLNQLVPLCEEMNGRVLIELYKICLSRKLRAYSVLKDELKNTHKGNLSLGVYSKFLSTLDEIMKPSSPRSSSPRESGGLPLPTYNPPPQDVFIPMPFIPAPNLNTPYDFMITSNASAFDTLRMVERYSSQLQLIDSLRRRINDGC